MANYSFASSGGSLLTQLMNNIWQSVDAKKLRSGLTGAEKEQNAFNASQAELAYQRQIDFYRNFNSPEAMVAQYKNAGLNPALMYQGAPGVNGASNAPQATAGSVMPADQSTRGLDLLGNILGIAKIGSEIKLLKAQARQQNASATIDEINSNYQGAINETSLAQMRANIEGIQSQVALNTQKIEESKSLQDLYSVQVKVGDANINLIDSNIDLNRANIGLAEAKKLAEEANAALSKINAQVAEEMLPFQKDLAVSTVNLNVANTRKSNAEAEESRQRALLAIADRLLKNQIIDSNYYDVISEKIKNESKYFDALGRYTNTQDKYYYTFNTWNLVNESVEAGSKAISAVGSLFPSTVKHIK